MDTKTIKKILKKYKKSLKEKIKVDELIVFGSRAWGRPRADSDIDVLVISEDFKKYPRHKWLDLVDKAAKDFEPEIQAWPLTPKQLDSADELTTIGQARTRGIRFV